jgi:hypothetical protein
MQMDNRCQNLGGYQVEHRESVVQTSAGDIKLSVSIFRQKGNGSTASAVPSDDPNLSGNAHDVPEELSLIECPLADCRDRFSGPLAMVTLRRHLAQVHFYRGLRDFLGRCGQLEHCKDCSLDLTEGTWLEHYCRHHNILERQIRAVLLFPLAGQEGQYTCPFCHATCQGDLTFTR